MNQGVVISVVAPVGGQASVMASFLRDVTAVLAPVYPLHEIILVDESLDESAVAAVTEVLRNFQHVRYLHISGSAGPDTAIKAGLDSAIGDFVVTLRPEEDPVEMLPELIGRCRQGGRIMCGVRQNPEAPQGWVRKLGGSIFRWYFRRYASSDLAAGASDFRVMDRHFVNAVTQVRDPHRNLRLLTAGFGFTTEHFNYTAVLRPGATVQRPTLAEDTAHALNLILGASHHPLRILSVLGLFLSFLNALYVLYIVAVNIFKDHVAEGWTTSSLQNAAMFFFLFLILAVLSEYVGVILREIRARHLYIVEKEHTSVVTLDQSITANVQNESRVG